MMMIGRLVVVGLLVPCSWMVLMVDLLLVVAATKNDDNTIRRPLLLPHQGVPYNQQQHHPHPRQRRPLLSSSSTTSSQRTRTRMLQEEQPSSSHNNGTSSSSSSVLLLKQKLLEHYDRTSYPFEEIWKTQPDGVRQGLEVQVSFNFHRVFDVDVRTSVADMIVWMRQQWIDPRLAWNNDDMTYNNVTTLHFWIGDGSGSGGETSEIWTPDLQLWNLETPLSATLSDAHAVVRSDGTVFWSRPGHVKPVCKLQGLDDFPFDTLDCTMEIGSWSYSGLYLRPTKLDENGYTVGGSETAGASYAEFKLLDVTAEEYLYPPYIAAPEEDWPVLLYHIRFQRAWQPYARGYLVIQIVLNLAAFCCLWLPPHIGERMSLSITSVLAAVASELVVAAKLPAAGEVTWFSKFSLVSMAFTALVLFESAAVIYFHYHTGDNLKPRWYIWCENRIRTCFQEEDKKRADETDKKVQFSNDNDREEAWLSQNEESKEEANNSPSFISEVHTDWTPDDENGEIQVPPSDDPLVGVLRESGSSSAAASNDEFFPAIDYEQSSEAAPSPSPALNNDELRESLRKEQRTRQRIKTLLGRDADDFKNVREMENNLRWQRVAATIDEYARVLFPVAFCIFLATTFSNLKLI